MWKYQQSFDSGAAPQNERRRKAARNTMLSNAFRLSKIDDVLQTEDACV